MVWSCAPRDSGGSGEFREAIRPIAGRRKGNAPLPPIGVSAALELIEDVVDDIFRDRETGPQAKPGREVSQKAAACAPAAASTPAARLDARRRMGVEFVFKRMDILAHLLQEHHGGLVLLLDAHRDF